MLFLKFNEKVFIITDKQIGVCLYLLIVGTYLSRAANKEKQALLNSKDNEPNLLCSKIKQLENQILKLRIEWLARRTANVEDQIALLEINRELLVSKQKLLISQLRGGSFEDAEIQPIEGDKKYIVNPDLIHCATKIDPDKVYEIHDPFLKIYINRLYNFVRAKPKIIDVGFAFAAASKSESFFQYATGLSLQLFLKIEKGKKTIDKVIQTAVIWVSEGLQTWVTYLSYIIIALISVAGLQFLQALRIATGQQLFNIFKMAFFGITVNSVIPNPYNFLGMTEMPQLPTHCDEVITALPSTSSVIREIDEPIGYEIARPITYVSVDKIKSTTVLMKGDPKLVIKIGKPESLPQCDSFEKIINDDFQDQVIENQGEASCVSAIGQDKKLKDIDKFDNFMYCDLEGKGNYHYTSSQAIEKIQQEIIDHAIQSNKSFQKSLRGSIDTSEQFKVRGQINKSKLKSQCLPKNNRVYKNGPLRHRTRTLEDLKKRDLEQFQKGSQYDEYKNYKERSNKILQNRYRQGIKVDDVDK